MRCLVFGGAGMLGQAVVAEARSRGWDALGLSREQADVTDRDRLLQWVDTFRPELVVNCAAFTRVDACEQQMEQAFAVNGEAVGHAAAAAARAKARLVHVSTDYVFDGEAREPYRENALPAPRSVYGRSKLEGERQALAYERSLVVRTSWLFGPGGPSFVATRKGAPPTRASWRRRCSIWRASAPPASFITGTASRSPGTLSPWKSPVCGPERPKWSPSPPRSFPVPRRARPTRSWT
jgi:dTDP-4-dehydrorhamnose reductase